MHRSSAILLALALTGAGCAQSIHYDTFGIEPRLRLGWTAFGLPSELNAGVRAHWESQERRQINATSATGRTGTLAEDQRRETRGHSGFVSNRFELGALASDQIAADEARPHHVAAHQPEMLHDVAAVNFECRRYEHERLRLPHRT